MVDPISDMLTRIRNAYGVRKDTVIFEKSKIKKAILNILKDSGYIEDFKEVDNNLEVILKYLFLMGSSSLFGQVQIRDLHAGCLSSN